ncbi:hypothetical protein ACFQNE_00500 [Gordonia phosphorivorans]|uniref:Secreted protein n=1 Tax=Gordonia phosphorivorans TaxID=1056982 RepID=A0ABV6H7K1_9ACTN
MATSLNRKNRRRKKAAALVAVGASATLLAGGLVPAQSNATVVPGVATCTPGGVDGAWLLPASADCQKADPALIATVGDALLGLVMPNLGISLGTFNGALATAGLELNLVLIGGNVIIPGHASIAGTGGGSRRPAGGQVCSEVRQ